MKKIVTALAFITFFFSARAQQNKLYFEHLNVADGLPENYITTLHQDNLGYIWIGTQNGMVRYDGYRMQIYKPRPYDAVVTGIMEDENSTIWEMGLRNSVYRYNRSSDSLKEIKFNHTPVISPGYQNSISDRHGHIWFYPAYPTPNMFQVNMMDSATGKIITYPWTATSAVYNAGRLWLGSNKGLICYDPATGQLSSPISPGVKIPGGGQSFILHLCAPKATPNVLWFSVVDDKWKNYGVFSYDTRKKTFRKYGSLPQTPKSIASDTIYAIKEDQKGRLWFGTHRGLSLYDPRTDAFINYTPPSIGKRDGSNPVTVIGDMAGGKLWMGSLLPPTEGHGLLSFDPSNGTFQRYIHSDSDPHSLSNDLVNNIMIDRTGVLWIGMAWGGLDHVNALRSQFAGYQAVAGQPNSYPIGGGKGIVQTPDGACWIGSASGIVKWYPNTATFSRVKLPDYLKDKSITVLMTDNEGKLWCTGGNIRVFTYDTKTAYVDTLNIGGKWPENSQLMAASQDHTGLIWFGTFRTGLYSYRKGDKAFKGYPYETGLAQAHYHGKKLDANSVIFIYEDREKNLWSGNNVGGFDRFNAKDSTFTSFLDRNKGFITITSAFESDKGQFWVGTYLSGLVLFDPKIGLVRAYTHDDGLLADDVEKILPDQSGRLWLFTQRGISLMTPDRNSFESFTSKNALPFAYSFGISAIETPQHEIVAAFSEGLVAFYPDSLHKNAYPPIVQLESVEYEDPQGTADNKLSLYWKNREELTHNQNHLTFKYIALHYVNPEENQYMYQLVGFDKDWKKAGTQRSVTYTNLSPGTYTFKVKAASGDGVWSKKDASVQVIIYPPWWFTWWAWALYIVGFATAIWSFIQFRSRKLLHDNRVLESKVQERTEEVMQQKEEIETQRDQLGNALETLKSTQSQLIQSEKMASLGELTAGIAHEIQNPLNFVNNFSEVSAELLDELDEELNRGDIGEAKAVASDVKQNLEKIRHHGKRADSIVKGMLEHSRVSSGQKELTDLNVLTDEYLRLAYHGLRAKDKNFNTDLVTNFDKNLPSVEVIPQDISRVLLNLFNNAFYAVNEKGKTTGNDYKPVVEVSTSRQNGSVIVKVKDNGTGIPDAVKDKIMQPFFTTKPTGEGTGLGLSLSYDIVVKGHGGQIDVVSKEGNGSEFIIKFPLN
jgi:signal transduction histidine kinase/ligand-binding sensor domain-containing protein